MQLNTPKDPIHTHEGARAKHLSPELQLRRSVMACLLWEDQFYESGVEISTRISDLISKVDPMKTWDIAVEAREKMKLRHIPLLLAREMARFEEIKVSGLLEKIIQRPDELTEFLAIYWKDDKKGEERPLSAQVKKGLARAFAKFDHYQLAKYNQDNEIKLRDVMFLVHPKAKSPEQQETFKKLADKTLEPPDTWEVALSGGADKKETFTRLIHEGNLGALALLRNLRNMEQAGVEREVIRSGLQAMKVDRVLPFRFITAARHAINWEPELEQAMFKCVEEKPRLEGRTALVIDVSYSMESEVSGRSEVSRMDAACGVAMIARELCSEVEVFTFSNQTVSVPPRRGFPLRDAIVGSQEHSGTDLGTAVTRVNGIQGTFIQGIDRIIVITDEQSRTPVPNPTAKKAYMINVASYKNGVGYGPWIHIDGWSEAVLDYIQTLEHSVP